MPDKLEYGDVRVVNPILQRVTADRTGCVTGVGYQEFLDSAVILGTTIFTSDNHFRKYAPRLPAIQYGWLTYSNPEAATPPETKKSGKELGGGPSEGGHHGGPSDALFALRQASGARA